MPHGIGALVDDLLEHRVDLLPVGEQLVQLDLAQHRAQRRLGKLARGVEVVLDLDDRLGRVEHPHVEHRVHLDRDVVPGDDVLRRDVERHDAERDALQRGKAQRHEDQPRSLGAPVPAQEERHAALVLAQDPEAHEGVDDDDGEQRQQEFHGAVLQAGKASTTTAAPCPPPMQAAPRP